MKMGKNKIKILGLLVLIIACFSFSQARQNAGGNRRNIYVFCTNPEAIKDELTNIFEKKIFTTQMEKIFNLEPANIDEIQKYEYYHNHIFIITKMEYSPLKSFLNKLFDEKILEDKFSKKAAIFYRDDLFADNQRSIFILGENYDEINKILKNNSAKVYDIFNSLDWERTRNAVYFKGLNDDEIDELEDNAPFMIDVPETYWQYKKKFTKKYNFISWWLRTPDRVISVFWIPKGKKNVSKDLILDMRKFVANKFFDEDVIIEENLKYDKTTFANIDCGRIVSNWRNDKYVIGGCFRSYSFYNKEQETLYLIDLYIMAPGKRKEPLLRQLETIGASFRFR